MAGMTCNGCGGGITFGQAFCPSCGSALAAPPPPVATTAAPGPAPRLPPPPPPLAAPSAAAIAAAAPPSVATIALPPPVAPSPPVAASQESDSVERLGRRLSATTLGSFLPVVVVWFISANFVVIAGGVVGSALGDSWLVSLLALCFWTVAGVLMFLRPVELALARFLFKLRHPTPVELGRLDPVWRTVCVRAGVKPDGYLLRVEDVDHINASACAGHIVSVTRGALELPDTQLAGIVAHELGHHRDLHPIALTLSWWYGVPVFLVARLALRLARVSAFFARFGLGWVLIVYLLRLSIFLMLLPVRVARFALALLGRPAEYAADRNAADIGYGHELMLALQMFIDMGSDRTRAKQSLSVRLWSSHPPTHKRMRALGKHMAKHGEPAAASG